MYSLCLGGGGAKGAYQIGAIKALKEYGIDFYAISGSSIGAINGLFLLGCDINKIEEAWLKIKKEVFLEIDDDDLFNGIASREGLVELINEYVDFDRFFNSSIPLFVTVAKGEQVEYVLLNNKTKQEVIDYVLASSAMPIIYGEVKINGTYYIDGGVIDNLPLAPLKNNDFEPIISIPLGKGYNTKDTIKIEPSVDLGGLIKGTLNFDKEDVELKFKLGYLNALECLYFDFKKDIDIFSVQKERAFLESQINLLPTTKDINRNLEQLKKYGF